MIETIDARTQAVGRMRDARWAGAYCFFFMAAISQAALMAPDAWWQRVGAALIWGAAGFAVAFGAVLAGGVRRNGRGGWDVTPAFAAVVLGAPVAALVAGLAPAMEARPSTAYAIAAAAAWTGAVLAVRIVLALRRRGTGAG
jgi:peptidoglycan/LPS O-acetylase OafA/YrhL